MAFTIPTPFHFRGFIPTPIPTRFQSFPLAPAFLFPVPPIPVPIYKVTPCISIIGLYWLSLYTTVNVDNNFISVYYSVRLSLHVQNYKASKMRNIFGNLSPIFAIHCESKKQDQNIKQLPINSPTVNRFSRFLLSDSAVNLKRTHV